MTLTVDGATTITEHRDVGPVEALTRALAAARLPVRVLGLTQHSIGTGSDSSAITYLEYRMGERSGWSCGRADSVLGASLAAVIRAASSR
ncbi:alpha-isopropylmalate synthase regulatory domain-containing protein [Nocardia amikacinitolerans]|uniref:alpha-isopropylmalate synthase regulatory domain-containing protein n=1 Tax=Nocardia amikacinitolerans TaxID=756689 RepID=UPI003FD7DD41